jgi:hypothetical protein
MRLWERAPPEKGKHRFPTQRANADLATNQIREGKAVGIRRLKVERILATF